MRYELLEEAGHLEIDCNVDTLDLFAVGVLHINLQDILDKTAFWLLSEERFLEPTWRRPKYIPRRAPYERIVRAQVEEIKAGSLLEILSMSVAAVLADPNVRAVLQNLFANAIWAMGASGIKGIHSRPEEPPRKLPPPFRRRRDPLDVGANLREIALALAERCDGKTIELKFSHETSPQERTELVIRIDGERSW